MAAFVFALALWLVRSQTTVTDTEYMRAMIPHHSIAIMTSERAHIRDPRVRKLAHDIILAQRREIAQMKYLIDDIDKNGVRVSERLPKRSEEHTSELQSLMRISYAVFCLKKKQKQKQPKRIT